MLGFTPLSGRVLGVDTAKYFFLFFLELGRDKHCDIPTTYSKIDLAVLNQQGSCDIKFLQIFLISQQTLKYMQLIVGISQA